LFRFLHIYVGFHSHQLIIINCLINDWGLDSVINGYRFWLPLLSIFQTDPSAGVSPGSCFDSPNILTLYLLQSSCVHPWYVISSKANRNFIKTEVQALSLVLISCKLWLKCLLSSISFSSINFTCWAVLINGLIYAFTHSPEYLVIKVFISLGLSRYT